MLINSYLQQKVKPIISYTVLILSLSLSLFLGYLALTSNILFFNDNNYQLNQSPYPATAEEYKQELLANKPEVIEEFILGQISGKPNFTKNVAKYDHIIKEAAKKYKVDCTLIKATMLAESQGNPNAKSWVGAVGLMQLMPLTAKALGYASNLRDPRVNIMAGAKYMALLKEKACHEKPKNEVCDVKLDVKFRLAAYNGGPKCNNPDWGECSFKKTRWECLYYDAYGETRQYVNRVKANYQQLKAKDWGC